MEKVGVISEIWRYPVKGMGGEKLGSCFAGPKGLSGDRIWAVRDSLRKEIQSCKFRPGLLKCRASFGDGKDLEIEFPDGAVLRGKDPLIHQVVSDLLGHESTLELLEANLNPDFFRRYKDGPASWLDELKDTFIREAGEATPDFTDFPQQAQDYVTVTGTFFLVSPIHIITSASMDWLRNLLPRADWDLRRFRPNIVIETDRKFTGLVEQGWIGKVLQIGGLEVDCTGTAIRCGAVTREQAGLPDDKTMLRTVVKEADQNVGVYARAELEKFISVGDPVYV